MNHHVDLDHLVKNFYREMVDAKSTGLKVLLTRIELLMQIKIRSLTQLEVIAQTSHSKEILL